MAFQHAGLLDELWDGDMAPRLVNGKKLLLVRIGDEVRAYADRCAHLGFPLSQGKLDGGVLTCAAHHYQYDVLTGQGVNPTSVSLTRYAVRLENGEIWIDTDGSSKERGC